MADRGAIFLHTGIWVAKPPGTNGSTAQITFPQTDQEAANLRNYAQDVAAVVAADGHRLRLDIALNWLGAADFTIGSPATRLSNTAYACSGVRIIASYSVVVLQRTKRIGFDS
jgi:hypothetical protein